MKQNVGKRLHQLQPLQIPTWKYVQPSREPHALTLKSSLTYIWEFHKPDQLNFFFHKDLTEQKLPIQHRPVCEKTSQPRTTMQSPVNEGPPCKAQSSKDHHAKRSHPRTTMQSPVIQGPPCKAQSS